MTDDDRVWQTIDAQRRLVADLLASLSDDEWRQPSLCDGWTVKDVAAHLLDTQLRKLSMVASLPVLVKVAVPQLVRMTAVAPSNAFRTMRFLAVFKFIRQCRELDLASTRFRVSRRKEARDAIAVVADPGCRGICAKRLRLSP